VKHLVLLLFFMTARWTVFAQYKPVQNKSTIQFSIKNFGISVSGSFTGAEGNILFDPAHPGQASFNVSIQSATVNTDNELRDSHLKKEAYFDSEHYPLISFVSTRITSGQNGLLTAYGSLTIKNHTKEVLIPFTAVANGDDYLFKGQFSINRKDFGIGGTSIIADTASIFLSIYASNRQP